MRLRLSIAALAGVALVLSACESADRRTPADVRDCFPEPSRVWIASASGATAARAAVQATTATVYVDRSASMVGYLNGATVVDRPFQDIVGTTPQSLREMGVAASFRAFGRTLTDPVADSAAMMQPSFFSCQGQNRASCEAAESHLDDVFREVAAKPREMAIIVSDLWFSNSNVDTSALAELKPMLTSILGSGRAIAVYGFSAPFNGTIYDLPAAAGQPTSVPHVGRHPLYMIVVGKDAEVAAFRDRLTRSGSPLIRTGVMPGGAVQQALFTASPTLPSALPREPLTPGASRQIKIDSFDNFNGLFVQQFRYQADEREAAAATAVRYPSWTGPDPALFAPNAVWEGPTQLRVRVWRKRDDKCRPTSWTSINALAGDWPRIDAGAQTTFELLPRLIRNSLRQEGDYVLTGEVRRVSISQDIGPSMAWMAQWSLDHGAGGYRAPPGDLFPTMNIVEFARIMQSALADEVEKSDRPVTGFTILVRSGDN